MVAKTIEDALDIVGGYGRFQKLLVLLSGLLTIPHAMPNLLMMFAAKESTWHCLPNATDCRINGTMASNDKYRCNIQRTSWEYSSARTNSIITEFDLICNKQLWVPVTSSVFFVGYAISSVLLGRLADSVGRKKILFVSTVGILVAESGVAASPNVYIVIGLRFVAGIFKGGTTTQAIVLACEYVNRKNAAGVSMFIMLCTVIGQVLLGVLAYFIQSWRLLVLLSSAPFQVLVLSYFIVPESIRWLVSKGRDEKAVIILKRIGRINGKNIHESEINFPTFCESAKIEKTENKRTICNLFQNGKHSKLSSIMGPSWLATGLMFYALSLASDQLGGSLYENFIFMMVAEVPGYVFASACSNKFGRRFSFMVWCFLSSVTCLLLIVPEVLGKQDNPMSLIVGITGKFLITGTIMIQYTWAAELYPTEIRAEGLGFLVTAQTIGGACAPWVVEIMQVWHPTAPYIFLGSMSLIVTFLQFFLPETHTKISTFSKEEFS